MTDYSSDESQHISTRAREIASTTKQGFTGLLPSLLLAGFLTPILMPVGPLLLMPHRIVLILVFLPLLWGLFVGWAGPMLMIDYALLFSTLWATIAIFISEGTGALIGANPVEASGIYWVEFFGAYLVGRVCIRSVAGFTRFVNFYVVIVLALLPFAVFEAVSHRPILLDLLPNSVSPVFTLEDRWGLRRAQTAFAHPILFGVFVSSGFGLFWYVLRPAIFQITGVFSDIFATILSLSSGAFISLVAQFFLVSWERVTHRIYWRWRLFAGLVLLAYVTVDLLSNRTPFHVLATYASFSQDSAYSRILIWEWGTLNVRAHPWFGLGLDVGNWERPHWKSASADNFWLLTAMTYGLPSLIAFAGAVFLIIQKVARATLTNPLAKRCQAGFLTSVGGIIIAGGTVHYWHGMLAFVMFFFGSGVWMIKGEAEPQTAEGTINAPDEGQRVSIYTRFPATFKIRDTASGDPERRTLNPSTPSRPRQS